ncbi:uncharacterized protein GGS22DRAFT_158332 [Annulohypoxylon maeteangense]|uniref:uncharacterized protein n=1 Tax=Annulohypoxylon maeteangense TaxID=1927788 RepID=UPI00200760FA|nr:uncharacterized protein GGS22DRAFT_158332 [Annulohypoxylon maeteangense]KAI0886643.1 hypothetical protein GGS22DRAFT_158332 [Annulohypoxylon maeteangense]
MPKSQESHVPFDHRFPKTSSNTGIQSLDPPAGIRLPPELMAQLHEPIRARNLPKSQESDLFLDFCSPDTSSNTGIQFLDPPFDLTTQLEYLRTCNALRSSSLLSSQKIQSSPKSSAEAAHKVLAPSNDDHRSSPLSIRTRKQSLPLPQNHGIRKPSSLPPPVTHAMKDQFMKDRLTKEGRQPTGEEEKNSDLSELDGDGSPCRLELGAQDNCQIHISF